MRSPSFEFVRHLALAFVPVIPLSAIGSLPSAQLRRDVTTVAGLDQEPILRFQGERQMRRACALVMRLGPSYKNLLPAFAGATTLFDHFNQVDVAEWENERAGGAGEHSATYLSARAQGWIVESVEADGGTSYQYAVCDPSLAPALNSLGMVVVGETLYQYTPDSIKECAYDSPQSVAALLQAVESSVGVTVTPVEPLVWCLSYTWSKGGGWSYWDGGRKRAKLSVSGTSSCAYTSVQKVTYSVNVKVERKNLFGNWVSGDFTCCYLYSSWKFRFGLAKNSVPFQCKTFYSTGLSVFPVNYTYPTTYWPSINNLIVSLHPSGYWGATGSGYDYFCDAFNVYEYAFTGSVCGGSSGVTLTSLYRP